MAQLLRPRSACLGRNDPEAARNAAAFIAGISLKRIAACILSKLNGVVLGQTSRLAGSGPGRPLVANM